MPVLKNAKHEALAQAYFKDRERVGWKAYKAIYPKSSQRAAETGFSRLLKKAEFAARIAELDQAVAQASVDAKVMDLQEVLAELSKLGRANMQDFIVSGADTSDVVTALRDMNREHAAAIQELTIETYLEGRGDDAREVKSVKLKLHDKRGALSELRKHHEPQKHQHEHAGKDGGAIEVAPAGSMDIARRIAFALAKARREAAKAAAKPKE
jgi:phage terminase small subunit